MGTAPIWQTHDPQENLTSCMGAALRADMENPSVNVERAHLKNLHAVAKRPTDLSPSTHILRQSRDRRIVFYAEEACGGMQRGEVPGRPTKTASHV